MFSRGFWTVSLEKQNLGCLGMRRSARLHYPSDLHLYLTIILYGPECSIYLNYLNY